jgi:hypothetical protein
MIEALSRPHWMKMATLPVGPSPVVAPARMHCPQLYPKRWRNQGRDRIADTAIFSYTSAHPQPFHTDHKHRDFAELQSAYHNEPKVADGTVRGVVTRKIKRHHTESLNGNLVE